MPEIARPERIVDASAYLASTILGVAQAFGCGGSGITFPVGVEIQPIPRSGKPIEPFTHFSEMPTAPVIRDGSATTTYIDWLILMRLHLATNDQGQARINAAPFYGRYLTAFHQAVTLGGTANSCRISAFSLGGDADTLWLQMTLVATERLNLDNQPGEAWV